MMNFTENNHVYTQRDFEEMGFDFTYTDKLSGTGNNKTDVSRLVMTKKKGTPCLSMSLCIDTAIAARKVFGERVNVGLDINNGRILITKGTQRRISGKETECGHISLGTATSAFRNRFGMFFEIYLHEQVYAEGNAILFTFTDEDIKR